MIQVGGRNLASVMQSNQGNEEQTHEYKFSSIYESIVDMIPSFSQTRMAEDTCISVCLVLLKFGPK